MQPDLEPETEQATRLAEVRVSGGGQEMDERGVAANERREPRFKAPLLAPVGDADTRLQGAMRLENLGERCRADQRLGCGAVGGLARRPSDARARHGRVGRRGESLARAQQGSERHRLGVRRTPGQS